MKIVSTATVAALFLAVMPARAADDLVERLATCQSSWLEWKNDPVHMKQLGESFQATFTQKKGERFFVPKHKTSVAGLPVLQAFPESLGMGVGFSIVVDAAFDKAKAAIEKTTAKTFSACETGDGMRHCELEVGEQKTLMVMAPDNANVKTTLFGCYYYYEK